MVSGAAGVLGGDEDAGHGLTLPSLGDEEVLEEEMMPVADPLILRCLEAAEAGGLEAAGSGWEKFRDWVSARLSGGARVTCVQIFLCDDGGAADKLAVLHKEENAVEM